MNVRYQSPLRQQQAAATRARIIDACVALLRQGRELTFSAVAAEAVVRDRTVYRYFPTKGDLEAEVWAWINEHLTHGDFEASTTDELVAAARRSFSGFDAGAPLIKSMLHSEQGLRIRQGQQTERRAMFERCVHHAAPTLGPQSSEQVAAALQVLYSGPAWELLREFWGMDGKAAAEVVELAIRALLTGVQASDHSKGADDDVNRRA